MKGRHKMAAQQAVVKYYITRVHFVNKITLPSAVSQPLYEDCTYLEGRNDRYAMRLLNPADIKGGIMIHAVDLPSQVLIVPGHNVKVLLLSTTPLGDNDKQCTIPAPDGTAQQNEAQQEGFFATRTTKATTEGNQNNETNNN